MTSKEPHVAHEPQVANPWPRCVTDRKNRNTQNLSNQENKYGKICAILDNWKMAEWIEEGFSRNNMAKHAENTSDYHHARSYHRLRDIFNGYSTIERTLRNAGGGGRELCVK